MQYTYVGNSGDSSDTASGHGTHVAGTVGCDDVSGGISGGVAPKVKLAVMDMAQGASEGLGVRLRVDAYT